MKKYLAYYENEWPANIAELTAVENKPFVGYLKGEGVLFTVIPKPQPNNEIWYTSRDGNVVTPNETGAFGANIVSNTYQDGKGVIKFDNSVASIGNWAFERCSALTSVTIGNSVTSIGTNAFEYCSSLTSIIISDSVTSIGTWAFHGCTGLTSITIPNSITEIGSYAFYDCTGLTSVTIPNSVTSLRGNVFHGCSGLTSIIVEQTNSIYDSRENCNAIIETASNTLLTGCKNTTILNGVTTIGDDAFYNCSGLTSIIIPNSVTRIGNSAFRFCSDLTSITYDGTQEQWRAISKGSYWNDGTPATYVQCSDGQVTL